MPSLPESKLTNPTFRLILSILRNIIQSTPPLFSLFDDYELEYMNYDSVEPEINFMNRLIQFLEHSTGKKLGFEPKMLVGRDRDPIKIHQVLQILMKLAKTGKITVADVKKIKKVPLFPEKENFGNIGKTFYMPKDNNSNRSRLFSPTPRKRLNNNRAQSAMGKRLKEGYSTVPPGNWNNVKPIFEEEHTQKATESIPDKKPDEKSSEKSTINKEQIDISKTPREINRQIEELKKKTQDINKQINLNKASITKLEKEKNTVIEENKKKTTDLQNEEKLKSERAEIYKKQDEIEKYKNDAKDIDSKIQEKDKIISELNNKISEKQKEIDEKGKPMKEKIAKQKSDNEDLRSMMTSNSGTFDSMALPNVVPVTLADLDMKKQEIQRIKKENAELEEELQKGKNAQNAQNMEAQTELAISVSKVLKLENEKRALMEEIAKFKESMK